MPGSITTVTVGITQLAVWATCEQAVKSVAPLPEAPLTMGWL
jgi:hypothetical protein